MKHNNVSVHIQRVLFPALTLLLAMLILPACKTGKDTSADLVPFSPQSCLAQLHVDKAAYPNLFSARSYALWVGPEITRQRRDEAVQAGEQITDDTDKAAAEIDENFLILECHIESVFEDMSIGYDAVGFRGIELCLQAPDGARIPPAQVIMGSALEEKPQGALKIFRRTNLIVFPKKNLNLMAPLSAEKPPSARLVLEGFNSTFYFEWFADVPSGQTSQPILTREDLNAAKMKYDEYCQKLYQFLHRFD
ncbi:MAG TPA: hypothetical protein PLI09_16080 [Candidatus Hydrogenedentes bacterium]|nr:hypothetical protein [Candidatus Hydrogenedentota bacterium]